MDHNTYGKLPVAEIQDRCCKQYLDTIILTPIVRQESVYARGVYTLQQITTMRYVWQCRECDRYFRGRIRLSGAK